MARALVLLMVLESVAAAELTATRASALGKAGQVASTWLADAYGLDADAVPVYLLPQEEFSRRYQRLGGRVGGMGVSVEGFAHEGVVYVKRGGLFGIGAKTLLHELLHALSRRFTGEAQSHGRRNVIEGVTEFFTLRAAPPEKLPPGVRVRRSVYGAYAEFAAHLAAVVGVDELAACYFERGYFALEKAVDRKLGGKGRLRRAAQRLEADDLQGALSFLRARP